MAKAGIGKSRLVEALAEQAIAGGARVLTGSCVPMFGSTMPLGPLRQTLSPLLAEGDVDLDGDTGRIFGDLAATLTAAAPAMLLLEDVHWADRLTLGFLSFLDRWLRARPVGLVALVTCRSNETDAELAAWLAEQARSPLSVLVDLAPLTVPQIGRLLTELTGTPPTPARLAAIAERSDGLPFYVEELAAASPDGVPARARDALRHRVAALHRPARLVVDAASVVGRHVEHDVLERVAALPEDALDEGLRQAVTGQVLVVDGDGYRFRHALLAEYVYAELLAGPRRSLHMRAANACEEQGAAPAEIAGHWVRSGDAERSLAWAMRAGDMAARLQAHSEAATWYSTALDHWDRVPGAEKVADADRADVLFRLGRAQRWSDRPAAGITTLRTALELLAGDSDPARRAEIHATLGSALLFAGENKRATEDYHAGYVLIADRPMDHMSFDITLHYANGLLHTGHAPQGLELCLVALDWAREHGGPEVLAHAVYMASGALFLAGRCNDAIRLMEDHKPDATLPWHSRVAYATNLSAAMEQFQCRPRAGLEVLLPLLDETDLARQLTDSWWPILCAQAATAALSCGEWDAAERYVWGAEFGGSHPEHTDVRGAAVDVLIERGQWDEAEKLHTDVGPRMLGRGEFSAVTSRRMRARILRARGRFGEAVQECLRGLDDLAGTSDEMYAGHLLVEGFAAAADAAEHARAARNGEAAASALACGEQLREQGRSLAGGPLGASPNDEYARNRPQALQCEAEWQRLHDSPDPGAMAGRCGRLGEVRDPAFPRVLPLARRRGRCQQGFVQGGGRHTAARGAPDLRKARRRTALHRGHRAGAPAPDIAERLSRPADAGRPPGKRPVRAHRAGA